MLVEFLCLAVVDVYLMALGMNFDSFGSLLEPIPGVLVSQGIFFELGQEGLGISLILDV